MRHSAKLDNLLVGWSRGTLLPCTFPSKVPNNAKQLRKRRGSAAERARRFLMWIRQHYPAGAEETGPHWKVLLHRHQGQSLKCHTSAARRDLPLINFQRFQATIFWRPACWEFSGGVLSNSTSPEQMFNIIKNIKYLSLAFSPLLLRCSCFLSLIQKKMSWICFIAAANGDWLESYTESKSIEPVAHLLMASHTIKPTLHL